MLGLGQAQNCGGVYRLWEPHSPDNWISPAIHMINKSFFNLFFDTIVRVSGSNWQIRKNKNNKPEWLNKKLYRN